MIWRKVTGQRPEPFTDFRLGTDLDRFEQEGDGFHTRVGAGFRALAAEDPDRWVIVDGSASADHVAEAVARVVAERLQLAG